MTKKQNSKKKITLKINLGEAAVVAPLDILQHISQTYAAMAEGCETSEEKQSWLDVSYLINDWVAKTYHNGYSDHDEEW